MVAFPNAHLGLDRARCWAFTQTRYGASRNRYARSLRGCICLPLWCFDELLVLAAHGGCGGWAGIASFCCRGPDF